MPELATSVLGPFLPGRIRGSVDLYSASGFVPGVVDGTQRTANHTALQAALDDADTNGKFVEVSPARYEYTSPGGAGTQGLYVKKGVAGLYGSGYSSNFWQYGTNVPVLTIGNTDGSTDDLRGDKTFGGLSLQHAATQTGQTNSDCLRVGRLWRSKLEDFNCGSSSGSQSYRGLHLYSNSGGTHFSNEFYRVNVGNGLENLVKWSNLGTGNKFINCYWGGGNSSNYHVCAGPVLDMKNGGSIESETVFDRCNIEWQSCNVMFRAENMRNMVWLGLHLEGMKFTGADPKWFELQLSSMSFLGGRWIDMRARTGECTGIVRMFDTFGYGWGVIDVRNVGVDWDTDEAGLFTQQLPFRVYTPTSDNAKDQVSIDNMRFSQNAATMGVIDMDTIMTEANSGKPHIIDGYRWNRFLPRSDQSKIMMPDANLTLYGNHQNVTVDMWRSITATRTLKLSNFMAGSGALNSVLRPVGDTVTVHPKSSQIINVTNQADTLITSIPAGSSSVFGFVFNGTNFVAI